MKLKSTIALAVLAFIAFAANAADSVSGFYMGGSLGMATTDRYSARYPVTINDDTDLAVSIRGGYRFLPYLAVEAGYADLGRTNYRQSGRTNRIIKTSLAHGDVVGIIPLSESIALFGKLGLTQVYNNDVGYKTSTTHPHFGAGASYALTPSLGLRAEYDDYGKTDYSAGAYTKSSQISLGLDYRF